MTEDLSATIRAAEATAEQREKVQARINRAISLHRNGQAEQAQAIYREVLKIQPCNATVLNLLGMSHLQAGRRKKAERLVARAVALDPQYCDAYNNLGKIYSVQGKLLEAGACFQRALALDPNSIPALANLSKILARLDMFDEMRKVSQRLLELEPDSFQAHCELGLSYFITLEPERAIESLRRAVELRPSSRANYHLGVALQKAGDLDGARRVYRDWLRASPDNPVAKHMLISLTEGDGQVPERAPDQYVTSIFDSFAASFDQVLGRLQYQAPTLVEQALQRLHGQPSQNLSILDAGCGTGLCGPLLRPFSKSLIGVDLSPNMLERAERAGDYTELKTAEITAYLQSLSSYFDAIVSADTLVYFGQLEEVSTAAYQALRPRGLLVFTLEALADDTKDLVLGPSGRYSHSEHYVRKVLQDVGFEPIEIVHETLRMENENAVTGLVVGARKPATA